MQTIKDALFKLEKSKFRSSFHLKKADFEYIEKVGLEKIRSHAEDFVKKRLAPKNIPNDTKQTPLKGHPVFISQHATACCCRSCLKKWYKVPENVLLTENQQQRIVNLIMAWIEKEIKNRVI